MITHKNSCDEIRCVSTSKGIYIQVFNQRRYFLSELLPSGHDSKRYCYGQIATMTHQQHYPIYDYRPTDHQSHLQHSHATYPCNGGSCFGAEQQNSLLLYQLISLTGSFVKNGTTIFITLSCLSSGALAALGKGLVLS